MLHRNFPHLSLIFLDIFLTNALNSPIHSCPTFIMEHTGSMSSYWPLYLCPCLALPGPTFSQHVWVVRLNKTERDRNKRTKFPLLPIVRVGDGGEEFGIDSEANVQLLTICPRLWDMIGAKIPSSNGATRLHLFCWGESLHKTQPQTLH